MILFKIQMPWDPPCFLLSPVPRLRVLGGADVHGRKQVMSPLLDGSGASRVVPLDDVLPLGLAELALGVDHEGAGLPGVR